MQRKLIKNWVGNLRLRLKKAWQKPLIGILIIKNGYKLMFKTLHLGTLTSWFANGNISCKCVYHGSACGVNAMKLDRVLPYLELVHWLLGAIRADGTERLGANAHAKQGRDLRDIYR